MLCPFVYWGQNSETINLRIDLKNVENPSIDLSEKELKFVGNGVGAKGHNTYTVNISFYEPILPKQSFFKHNERQIDFILKKSEFKIWPRLFNAQMKPIWLKVDFDKFHTGDTEDEADNEFRTRENIFKDLRDKNFGRRKKSQRLTPEEFRKVYLFLYNLFQFVGFVYILVVLTIRYAKDGSESVRSSYKALSGVMKVLHLIQVLEIIHPLIRYTSGSVLFTSLHLINRLIFIFVMIDGEPRMQMKPVVLYLFLLYTTLEIIRYPYYMFKVCDVNISLLAWLHHTAWIPLFPMIFFSEAAVLFRNISYFEETEKFSLFLPNAANFSFYLPHLIRIYLLTIFFPVMYMVFTRKYRKRKATMALMQKCSKMD
ncbi:very-long-chain (3R)-3-hydroxyacyl-CoA dehydratase-like protein [Leptotrombidium deliense]|uniref:Very-long-chain (3R)-3-hydroxyacyl-CoA dehydratase n=1 Tax=Leptotrombidium deliense TaxID=299467 RepID=A0A443S1R2_9ACAR|nr:very-long-chain (3R)-3-hydroxyacyl-CoA dehydratase-like protein [Leptotrombidium deliense]